jgi:2-amino-4-hydroxy-6-hydroxymethyldihydropteridine diphosphokinase
LGKSVIFVALGANLPHPRHGPPRAVLEAALTGLQARGLRVVRRSRWYRSPAWPPGSGAPDYVNGVAEVACDLEPQALLAELHAVEAEFGRARGIRNAPRTLDLDLLDWHGVVRAADDGPPELPHPRMHERGFVLLPLAELAPDWRHPASGRRIDALIEALPPETMAEPL